MGRAKKQQPNRRILIAYGSMRGGTAGLAEMLAGALRPHRLDVEVADAAEVDGLEGYDAVIVGGALYNNRWHSDATALVSRFLYELRALPVWFFSSGPLDESARSGELAPIPQVRELARSTDIRGHMTFGGVLESKPRRLLGGLLAYGPVGDFRNLHQVADWAQRIVHQLDEPRTMIELDEPYVIDTEPDGAIAKVRRLLTADDDLALEDDAGLDVLL